MPYIKMKCWPKDEAVKKEFVEKLNALLLETWGCAQKGVSISIEEVAKEDWEEQVVQKEILPNIDKMMIVSGEKKY